MRSQCERGGGASVIEIRRGTIAGDVPPSTPPYGKGAANDRAGFGAHHSSFGWGRGSTRFPRHSHRHSRADPADDVFAPNRKANVPGTRALRARAAKKRPKHRLSSPKSLRPPIPSPQGGDDLNRRGTVIDIALSTRRIRGRRSRQTHFYNEQTTCTRQVAHPATAADTRDQVRGGLLPETVPNSPLPGSATLRRATPVRSATARSGARRYSLRRRE